MLNVALDLLAVAVLGMGVEGPAWATVISQAISGLLCLAIMGKRYPVLRFRPGELRPSRTHITRLFAIGVPMGLQYSVTAIGTIVTALVPDNRKGEGVGYYMLSVTLGAAIGPFLGMFLTQNAGFQTLFLVPPP